MSRRRAASSDAMPRVLPFDSRRRIAAALERCTRSERAVLSLMLYERLSTIETADVLGLSAREVEKVYGGLLRELDGAIADGAPRVSRRARLEDDDTDSGLRKAS